MVREQKKGGYPEPFKTLKTIRDEFITPTTPEHALDASHPVFDSNASLTGGVVNVLKGVTTQQKIARLVEYLSLEKPSFTLVVRTNRDQSVATLHVRHPDLPEEFDELSNFWYHGVEPFGTLNKLVQGKKREP